MSTTPQHADLTLIGYVRLPDGTLRLVTHDGRQFACRNARELWADLQKLATEASAPALPPGPTHQTHRRARRVQAQTIPCGEATAPGRLDSETVARAATEVADVAEEAAAQEYGALGRLGVQMVRQFGPEVMRNMSPRRGMRRGRKR